MAWKIEDINVGEEVAIAVTVLKLLDDGRASVSIPSYGFPHSIPAPRRSNRVTSYS
ncbi:hypothetical protein RQ479_13865 [Mesorhizobium sp. ISC25]|uniref:hypothetical protein n=1 Tax=Mesorhizobium sp. ISC25 TaxID=3077335 RepID=UPI0035E2D32F